MKATERISVKFGSLVFIAVSVFSGDDFHIVTRKIQFTLWSYDQLTNKRVANQCTHPTFNGFTVQSNLISIY
nr:MAG TPA: hypothetical protein [Bacteriophage sp.]